MARAVTEHHATITQLPVVLTSLALEPREVLAERSRLSLEHSATALTPTWQARMEAEGSATAALRALEDATIAASVAVERALTLAVVLDEAIAVLADTADSRSAPPVLQGAATGIPALSPREREVLVLVAKGCTNKVIAKRLFVSPNTIKTHVASLLTKLQADSRAELAAIAVRQGLG